MAIIKRELRIERSIYEILQILSVTVQERKTKIDWAYEFRIFLEEDFPNAEKVERIEYNYERHVRKNTTKT